MITWKCNYPEFPGRYWYHTCYHRLTLLVIRSGGAGESHPHAPTGRVENWRGALWVRFQFPPRQTQHADFPHYAFSVNFVYRVMWPIILAALSSPVISNSIIVIQFQSFIKPGPTPPVRAKSVFTFRYIFLLRSCRIMHDFIISPLPPGVVERLLTAGSLCSPGITPVHR